MSHCRLLSLVAALCAAVSFAQPTLPERVGPAPNGGFALNSLFTVKPAGRQIELDTFPMSGALSPDGRFLVILHAGYNRPSLRVLDAKSMRIIDNAPLRDAWLGLAFAPGGKLLYVGGGATAAVYEFGLSDEGKLKLRREFTTVPRGEAKTDRDFIGDVQVSADGRLIYASGLLRNEVLVINPQSGWVVERYPMPRQPYRIMLHPDGESFFVTSWAEGSVHHFRAADGAQQYMLRLGLQPMDMAWRNKPLELEEGEVPPPWSARLFVATANTNRVHVLGVTESKDFRRIESIKIATWPWQPLGMTPTSLELSKDQQRLYVVCSNANMVAVVDVSGLKCRVMGFIPTGWYPTDVTALADSRLVVLNGKGGGSAANNGTGPNPLQEVVRPDRGSAAAGFVGALQAGTASVIEALDEGDLFAFTKEALGLSPYDDERLTGFREIPLGNPIPPGASAPDEMKSPIEHVLYIVKENRSYDQVLGDIGVGSSDPSLAVFGEKITPNHHKLARDFILFDNFFAVGDVSADGWFWSTAAIAPAFIERMWPGIYAGRTGGFRFDQYELASAPPTGFLWNQATQAGLSVRNFGFAVRNTAAAEGSVQVKEVVDPALDGLTDRRFRGFDPDYPDVKRAEAFLEALAEMETANDMPRLMVMRLGNDHTQGTLSGKIAPLSAMADNDYALGRIVEGCSASGFWPKMAIFVVEDDASGGQDHVDSHRSIAFAISPYTRRALIDSSMYNTASVLRTVELILGLNPMTQFDAAAMPMWLAFADQPDTRPWESVKPRVSLTERNP